MDPRSACHRAKELIDGGGDLAGVRLMVSSAKLRSQYIETTVATMQRREFDGYPATARALRCRARQTERQSSPCWWAAPDAESGLLASGVSFWNAAAAAGVATSPTGESSW